ncbi:hypothetical protein GEMRC1_005971 [Eukaryota sp. GEM-RC1]
MGNFLQLLTFIQDIGSSVFFSSMGAIASICSSKSLINEIEAEINTSMHSSFSGSYVHNDNAPTAEDLQNQVEHDADIASDDEDDFLRIDGLDSTTVDIVQAFTLGHHKRQSFMSPVQRSNPQNSIGRTIASSSIKGNFIMPNSSADTPSPSSSLPNTVEDNEEDPI